MKKGIIENMVEMYTEDLYRWAYYKTSSSETAEDLVQDTFLVAAEKYANFEGKSSEKTWLFSILNNKIIDFYRKKSRKKEVMSSDTFSNFFDITGDWQQESKPKDWEEDDGHLLDNPDFQSVLKKCLDALPEKWNACVKLKYLSSKSGEEICQEIGITSSNFWQIIHRSKLQLRDCIDVNWFKN